MAPIYAAVFAAVGRFREQKNWLRVFPQKLRETDVRLSSPICRHRVLWGHLGLSQS